MTSACTKQSRGACGFSGMLGTSYHTRHSREAWAAASKCKGGCSLATPRWKTRSWKLPGICCQQPHGWELDIFLSLPVSEVPTRN